MENDMELRDAIGNVKTALAQIHFTVKLLEYCERGELDLPTFDKTVVIKKDFLRFPTGHFSKKDEVVHAAKISFKLAVASSAFTLDEAWKVVEKKHGKTAMEKYKDLQDLVYMVRCAFAHGIATPRWEAKGRYRRVLNVDLPEGAIELDMRTLDGKPFDLEDLGGYRRWVEIIHQIRKLEDMP